MESMSAESDCVITGEGITWQLVQEGADSHGQKQQSGGVSWILYSLPLEEPINPF